MRLRRDGDMPKARFRFVAAALVLGLAVLSQTRPAQAAGATAHSVTNCNDSGNGSLRQVVANAPSGATVTFSLSPPCVAVTLASTIRIARSLTVEGPGARALTVSGNRLVEDFHIDSGATVTISGLTIEKGRSPTAAGSTTTAR